MRRVDNIRDAKVQFRFIEWLTRLRKDDWPLVGTKAANLGELRGIGMRIPNGFCATVDAFRYFIEKSDLQKAISSLMDLVDSDHFECLVGATGRLETLIRATTVPDELKDELLTAYHALADQGGKRAPVAVRSSATAEDLPEASFAGQLATYLHIEGDKNLLQAVRECWGSLFSERAMAYVAKQGFTFIDVAVAVVVETMIDAEVCGVMFTVHPVTKNYGNIIIEASFGLGQAIVEGFVNPDTYVVDKQTLQVLETHIASKQRMITKSPGVTGGTIEVDIPKELQNKPCLTAEEVQKVAKLGQRIERHYDYPQDIEWAISEGKVYILQTRPVTAL